MTRWHSFWIISAVFSLGLLILISPATSANLTTQPEATLITSNDNLVKFEVTLPSVQLTQQMMNGKNWDCVHMPGMSYGSEAGTPDLPSFTRLVSIPGDCGVRFKFEALESHSFTGIDLVPAQNDLIESLQSNDAEVDYNADVYEHNELFPSSEGSCGAPALMRGLRVVPVKVNPVRYNPVTRELNVVEKFRVTIYFEGTDTRNNPVRPMRPVSREWAKLLEKRIVNYEALDLDIIPAGSYLIICKESTTLLNNLEPFVEWKTRKGHTVVIDTYSGWGINTYTIKSMIQDAYDSWDIPPEYVLLWGDTNGTYALPAWSSYGYDHPYSELDGDDVLADVAIGRYPADDATQTTAMVNKVLFYEKSPYITDTDWFEDAVLVAGNSYSGLSTIQVNQWIKSRLIEAEYTQIDTFWYNMGVGSVELTLTNSIDNGVSLVNYRGRNGMEGFDLNSIDALTNGYKLPFCTILTCGTGGFSTFPESNMEHFVNVGSPTFPKGAVACVGTATLYTHTRQNNTIDIGMYAGMFEEDITIAGHALNRGKLELYNTFQDHDPGTVEDFSNWNALAGDPGLSLWTGPIHFMECNLPASVTWGENQLALTVQETGGGPVADALVCVYKEGDIHEVGLTEANGVVILPLNLTNDGNVKVTVTAHNFYPIVDSLNVIQGNVLPGYYSHTIDDDNSGTSSGDGDGIINPAETVEVPVTLKNYGSSTSATGISVTASTSDPYITIIDANETFPNLAPGVTGNSLDDFDFVISNDSPNGHEAQITLAINSNQGNWDGLLEFEVVSYDVQILSAYAAGSDTLLSPGETSDFVLEVQNIGDKQANNLTATVSTSSQFITINDANASFGTVNIDAIEDCAANPFNLTCSSDAPDGYPADLLLSFVSSSGATLTDTITIFLGAKSSTDPQGPDDYGYFCFDDTDTDYPNAPVYNWIEIDPNYGGSGTQLPIVDEAEEEDMSVNVTLPFTFQYYGQDVTEITVCSNGWLSMIPNVVYSDFRNYPIPSPAGPDGMVAPFWDDLVTVGGGIVCDWYDAANNRYVVEWSRMRHVADTSTVETFEIVLYDPAYYPTPTGDGDILFQYHTIEELFGLETDIPYSTVGIESQDQRDGIEVVYWNTYSDPAASELADERAYLFTTDFVFEPSFPALDLDLTYVSGSPVPAGGGNIYFDIWVQNIDQTALNFDGWLDIEYEGGPPTTVINRAFENFQPGWAVNRPNTWFPVPGAYAAGNYEMLARLGDYPATIWYEDGFPFTKAGADFSGSFVPFIPDNLPDYFGTIDTNGEIISVPNQFELVNCYPNPFNPTTTISYALPEAAHVKLTVFNVNGQVVKTLVDGYRSASMHQVTFDASQLSSGLYFYKIEAGNYSDVKKMVLVK